MVQMYFEIVSQTKPSITLNDLPQDIPNVIRLKLVTASQTNAYHLILHILTIADSQSYQIYQALRKLSNLLLL